MSCYAQNDTWADNFLYTTCSKHGLVLQALNCLLINGVYFCVHFHFHPNKFENLLLKGPRFWKSYFCPRRLTLYPQCPLTIPWTDVHVNFLRISWEILFNDQCIFPFMIILLIHHTISVDDVLIFLRESSR